MKPGDRVIVGGGAFATMEADVLSIDGDTALLCVDLFDQVVEQRVPIADLQMRADPESVRRDLEYAAVLFRARAHDLWWAARVGRERDPVAEYRAFEEHALAYDAALEAELDAIEAEVRALPGVPPKGWHDAQMERLELVMPQPSAPTEQILPARERRARALDALRASGEIARYVGHRAPP